MTQSQPTNLPDYFPDDLPLFTVGQLVRHCRYGYRGLVVDFDVRCRADNQWYRSNLTQPRRDQTWYHLLVHDSTINTYAAQENLVPDPTPMAIDHPLVEQFFDRFDLGRYVRNDNPWPEC